MRSYWLMKFEPDVYSIDDLAKEGSAYWEGVRNYSARNNMQKMKVGDLVLFYHSNASPSGVAGIAQVAKEAYPDRFQWEKGHKYFDARSKKDNPRWYMVDVAFVEKFPEIVPLATIRETEGLEDMVLVKRSRLSVQPVTREEFGIIKKMGKA